MGAPPRAAYTGFIMRIARLVVCCALLPPGSASDATYSPLAGIQDGGSFTLLLNEEPAATIRFRIDPDGALHNHTVLSVGGEHVTTVMRIRPPSPSGVAVDLREYRGRISFDSILPDRGYRGWDYNLQLQPPTFFDCDYGPALLTSVIRRYDRTKNGVQSFPVYVLPGFPGGTDHRRQTATIEWIRHTGDFDEFAYEVPAGRYNVLADRDGLIQRIENQNGRMTLVRDGVAGLAEAREPVTIERNVSVRMRDGVELSTDIFRPRRAGRFPVILQRTPYKKEMLELQAKYYARRGYAYAAQDVRGRFSSGGLWEPFVNEGDDGFDTVEWLAAQPWSSGKVGMIGGSYDAVAQWYAASRRPPHLVTIVPSVSPPDPFLNVPYEFGVFRMGFALWWSELLARNATADLSGRTYEATRKDFASLLRPLPVIALDEAVIGRENAAWRRWIEHPARDDYWERLSFHSRLKQVRLPVFHQSGWFDGNGIGTKLNYLRMAENHAPYQKLVIGPWMHGEPGRRRLGSYDFGPDAALDLQNAYLRWFDHWLKGVDNSILREPLVSLFVMGANKWLHADRYPLPGTQWEKWYLHPTGLSPDPPARDAQPWDYTYDPANPTPTPETFGRLAETRSDMLAWLSPRFEAPMTIAGPVSAVLYASTSARDTDWFVSLFDVDPSGRMLLLGQGKLRARFRRSLSKPELLTPGRVYEYRLDLWHAAIEVDRGHRLKVEVASASFPEFSRNLNTGGHSEVETEFVIAEQTVYCSAKYPSHIVLPVVKARPTQPII